MLNAYSHVNRQSVASGGGLLNAQESTLAVPN